MTFPTLDSDFYGFESRLAPDELDKLGREYNDLEEVWKAEKAKVAGSAHIKEEIDVLRAQMACQEALAPGKICRDVDAIARQIIGDEREARRLYMASDGRVELEDKLMRSYGVAANARRLTAGEFMSLLSDIKLALSLGLIDGLEHVTLHRLLIEAQPASLRKRADRDLTLYERDVLRADIVRGALRH